MFWLLRPIDDRLWRPGTGPSSVRDLRFFWRSILVAVIWKAHSVTIAAARVVAPTYRKTERPLTALSANHALDGGSRLIYHNYVDVMILRQHRGVLADAVCR